jgi:uncharacterized membrane protein YjjB (DUF3815 family)
MSFTVRESQNKSTEDRVVFAAFKIIGTLVLACASVIAAIVESGHPVLFGCLCAAFVVGIVGAETLRVYRNHNVRSSIN